MRIIRLALLPLTVLPFMLRGEALFDQYDAAVRRIQARHAEQWDPLVANYRNYLDRLIAEAQPRGDIESIAVYLDEKERPGSQTPTAALEAARGTFDTQRARIEKERDTELHHIASLFVERLEEMVRERTRAGDLDSAITAWNRKQEVREKLDGLSSADGGRAAGTLGPDLFPEGRFERVRAEDWVKRTPGGDANRSGFHIDTRAGQSRQRNTVLRLHQDERSPVFFAHPVPLEPGRQYQVSWRTSMARPWRTGIELRGKGTYEIGFQIGGAELNQIEPRQRALLSRRAAVTRAPPPGAAWESHSVVLEAGPHMNQLFIQASPGEGEILIDNIEVREILSPAPQR